MIEHLISFSLKQRLFILICVLLLIGLGAYSFLKLPIDAFPDVTNIQVEVLSSAPGLSPLEVEKFVTYPIEMAMRGLPRLAQLRSISKFGLSVITVVFEDRVDIYFARQLVFERLMEAKEKVPEGIGVSMGPVATAMGEIYQYTLEGEMPTAEAEKIQNLTELRTIQDWVLTPMLKSIPGVNEINSFGGYIKQYHVVVDPDKLLKYDLSVNNVADALKQNNINVGGNVLESYSQQYLIRGIGLLQSVLDIKNVIVKSEHGVPIFMRDIADIHVRVVFPPAVVIRCQRERGIADLRFPRKLRFRQGGHPDDRRAPASVKMTFSPGGKRRSLHAHVGSALVNAHAKFHTGVVNYLCEVFADRIGKLYVPHDAVAVEG